MANCLAIASNRCESTIELAFLFHDNWTLALQLKNIRDEIIKYMITINKLPF